MIELGHRNENGLDYGDWANRVGLYFYARALLDADAEQAVKEFDSCLHKIEIDYGIYCRYPKAPWNATFEGKWAFSRDQQTPLVIAMGAYPDQRGRLLRLCLEHHNRNWKYQNSDWASPEHMNYYNRALDLPLNILGDWFMLLNSLIIVTWSWFQPTHTTNDLNHTLALLQAMFRRPTIVSKLAHFIYRKLRRHGVQWAWNSYFNNNPPLDEVYRPIIERYFK